MTNTERLRPLLANLEPDHYQRLRDAYYKAAEGLANMVALLEEASDYQKGFRGEIIHAREAKKAFDASKLGNIL